MRKTGMAAGVVAVALLLVLGAGEARAQSFSHIPPEKATADRTLEIAAKIPASASYAYVSVFYKRRGGVIYKSVFMQPEGDGWVARVPGDFITFPGLEYYIAARARSGAVTNLFRSPEAPMVVPVAEEARDEEEDELGRTTESLADELAVYAAEDTIVVSASRGEQKLNEAPSAITVITAKDIQSYGSESLPEVLRTVPGMEVMRTYTMNPEVTARGFTREGQNKILTMVDGRSVYVDLFGTTFWEFLPISVWEIKRVEVIRGPGSALYGANAFSGVVSIFTKRPEDIRGFQLYQSGGETGLYTTLLAGDVKGDAGYRASASFGTPYKYDRQFDTAGQIARGDMLVEYKLTPTQTLSMSGGFTRGQATPVFTLIGPIGVEATQGFVQADYKWRDLSVRAFYTLISADLDVRFPFPPKMQFPEDLLVIKKGTQFTMTGFDMQMPPVYGLGHTVDVEAVNVFTLHETDRLTVGGNVREVMFKYRNGEPSVDEKFTGTGQELFGSFIQNEWRPIQELIFTAGFRFDLQSVNAKLPDGSQEPMRLNYSPRASIVFLPHPDHSIRIGGGLAFRNPAFMETDLRMAIVPAGKKTLTIEDPNLPSALRTVALKDVGIDFHGNQELGPEKILSAELGYGVRLFGRVRLNLDLFYEQVTDLILFNGDINRFFSALDTQQNVSNEDIFTFQNLADARNIGAEAAVDVQVTEWLKVFANYAWQKVTLQNKNEIVQNGFKVPTLETESPAHKANAGFNLSKWKADLNVYGHYVSATHRENFITNLPAEPVTLSFAGRTYKYTLDQLSVTPSKGTSDVPQYVLLNANTAYTFLQGMIRVGLGCEDILGTSGSVNGDGFVTSPAFKLQSGRTLQYPRLNLFGSVLGGELIGRRFYGFLSAKF